MDGNEIAKADVKVFGCGGSGINIIQRIHKSGIPGIQTIAVSDNVMKLLEATVDRKILTGRKSTKGIGGYSLEAIERDLTEIESDMKKSLEGCNVAILAAGLGGRSSSVIPGYISRVAKEMDPEVMVIGIVTLPSGFEGKIRKDNAIYGLRKMIDSCDTVILFSLDSLFKIYEGIPLDRTFLVADEFFNIIINSILSVIDEEMGERGMNELREIFGRGKMGTIGIGESEDTSSPLTKATEEALQSPLIIGEMKEADTVIMIINSGHDISQSERDEAASLVKERIETSAMLKIHNQLDPDMKDTVNVIILFLG